MINLLPPKNKEEFIQDRHWKLVMILGILVLIFLTCFSLILFSIKTFTSGQVEVQKILFDQKEEEFKNSQLQTFQEKVVSINKTLSQLEFFYQNKLYFTELLEKISKIIPSEIYFTNLSAVSQLEKINFSLSGFSPTRDILLGFKRNLEKEEKFTNINFPPSSWAEPENINFSVTFEIK